MVFFVDLVLRSRMRGVIPPLPQYVFTAWYLVKHRDNFTFTFTFYFFVELKTTWLNEVYHKYSYKLCMNILYKPTITTMATVTNFEVMSDKVNVDRICLK
jgi:hypothetical protein